MNDSILVSVVLIFFNEEKFISEAIESVIHQTYTNWDLYLVDDGSTDRSTAIAKEYSKKFPEKIRYLEHKNHINSGMSASRNLGIKNSGGEYIALIDSDDKWLPNKLERQVSILKHSPEVSLIFGAPMYWYSWSGEDNDFKKDNVPDLGIETNKVYGPSELTLLLYPLGNSISPCPSDLFIKKSAIMEIEGFEEHFRGKYQVYEDQAFLSKIYLKYHIYVSDETWDYYRIHTESCMSVYTDWYKSENYYSIRKYFLNWFERYLKNQKIENANVWITLEKSKSEYQTGYFRKLSTYLSSYLHK